MPPPAEAWVDLEQEALEQFVGESYVHQAVQNLTSASSAFLEDTGLAAFVPRRVV